MEIVLDFQGEDANEKIILDAQEWFKQEDIEGLMIQRKRSQPGENEMGPELETILSVILGSAGFIQLAKSIQTW